MSSGTATDMVGENDQATLLRLARQALETAVRGEPFPPLDMQGLSESLCAPRATFVTLTRRGALRGCIGVLQAQLPLAEDVREHAVAAALQDFRFPPVRPEEVGDIDIEISILTPPRPLEYDQPEDLLTLLRPGTDGVIIESGLHRATFLPQVWEKVPDAQSFLTMLCEKAALPGQAWRKGVLKVYTYQVQSFHEGRPHNS